MFLSSICLVNAMAFFGIAVIVRKFHPRNPATFALVTALTVDSIFFATAIEQLPQCLLGFHWLPQALAAAALLHLALTFPVSLLGRKAEWVLPFVYLPSLLFGLVHLTSASDIAASHQFQTVATAALAACTAAVGVSILHGTLRATSLLTHRQSALAGIGIIAALATAGGLSLLNGADAATALQTIASTSFVAPLCIAYATRTEDVLVVDAALRRTLTCLAIGLLATIAGVAAWTAGALFIDSAVQPPFIAPLVTIVCVLLVLTVRKRVNTFLQRWTTGTSYGIGQTLAELSRALSSVHTIEGVVAKTRTVLTQSIRSDRVELFVCQADGTFRTPAERGTRLDLPLPAWRIVRLERGEIQWRAEEEGLRGAVEESSWTRLDSEVLVPVFSNGSLLAVLALGAKRSRRSYNAEDFSFLRAAAEQIAVSMSNAAAINEVGALRERLRDLNTRLAIQVAERTAALETSNAELSRSLEKLQYAYVKLERSQANVLRSDRLATLGRLTAGLAHEMNTPLSAVLNSLKLIHDLAEEYQSSIDDPDVLSEDHREIAAELILQADAAAQWANKAATFLRSVKAHGRDASSGPPQRFAIRDVIADARSLVAHRLRSANCRIDVVEEPAGITLDGDPSRFNQVLVNLLTNAIDAYEERGMSNVCIEIRAWSRNGSIHVQVRDWAGGIPTSILPHIFDELYTTKGPGRGTGLGLWISRNIVEEALGGTLDVITNSEGSCFVAEFPQRGEDLELLQTDGAPDDAARAA